MDFGDEIKAIRTVKGLSMARLAGFLNAPLRTVEDWESYTRRTVPPAWVQPLIKKEISLTAPTRCPKQVTDDINMLCARYKNETEKLLEEAATYDLKAFGGFADFGRSYGNWVHEFDFLEERKRDARIYAILYALWEIANA